MHNGDTMIALMGGVWVILIFIAGIGWRILKELQKIGDTAVGGSGTDGRPAKSAIAVTLIDPPPPTP